ncbi:MAG TPA: His/Gly/Thr/Pro-type tRNA ligase C-terminal domain-containing protein, partial [Patescibacteria group bacterium]|nr:His/Gly/Thr/Pro-type tRNA ligase C-terminal domain-containing protein [Patescibacteria group bacterium]
IKTLPQELQAHSSAGELQHMLGQLEDAGIKNVEFDVTIMRGFDYYTDLVFEIFDNNPENNRSMMGGGRYDGLVGLFGVEPVPTVGFGLGDVTLQNFLNSNHLLPELRSETDLFVATIGELFEPAQKPLKELRQMGLNVVLGAPGKKLGDQFKVAEKKGIHYVLIVGEQELKDQQYTLKNLQTGEEEKHGLQRIVSIIKDYRKA